MQKFRKQTLLVKIIIVLSLISLIGVGYSKLKGRNAQKIQYQTETVQKGNLIVSISASGQVSTANNATVTTETSGVITKIHIKNGDMVKTGDTVAEVELDLEGRQRSAQAYASYQSAKNSLDTAKANLYTAQSDLLTKWDNFMDKAQSSTYQNSDKSPITGNRTLPDFMTTNDDWLAAEAKYKIQQNTIAQSQTSLNSAWYSYQQASPVIYAPISGLVTGLSLQVGSVITAQSNANGGATSQKIANIQTTAVPTITINLTQIDIPKVAIGNKATVSLDAFPDKTFTGSVISLDTVGTVSSGVATYPTVIKLDTDLTGILSNMTAQANIITNVKNDVLIVSSSAVQMQNGSSSVRVMKSGQVQTVAVETGLSSDTQTEIISGLLEGDTVVTGTTTTGTGQSGTSTTSPFSAFGARGFGGGGGGQFRAGR